VSERPTFISWGTPAPVAGEPPRKQRWRTRLGDFSWFDLVSAVLGVLIWDFVTGLVLSGVFAIRCGGTVCTLHQNLTRDQMLYWLVPVVMFLPPVLLVLKMGRMRTVVIVAQVIMLGALTLHTLNDAHVTRQRIDGTVPCWNPLYSPKECPWGVK